LGVRRGRARGLCEAPGWPAQVSELTGQLASAAAELAKRDARLAAAERGAADAGALREQHAKVSLTLSGASFWQWFC